MEPKTKESPFSDIYRGYATRLLDVHSQRPRRVLDVGSGGGMRSVLNAKAFGADHLTMVDAQLKPTGASDLPWKGYKMDIRDQKFVSRFKQAHNVIVCLNAFHELDIDIAIKRFMQIIPRGGFLIIQETTHAGWLERVKESVEYNEEDREHLERDLEKVKRDGMFEDQDISSFWKNNFGKKVSGSWTELKLDFAYFIVYCHAK